MAKSKLSNWFLACFGIPPSKTVSTSDKKVNKPGRRGRWFKLCMPKIKVIIIRRRKGSFDTTRAALKASQSIIKLETSKVKQQRKMSTSIGGGGTGFLLKPSNQQKQKPKQINDKSDEGERQEQGLVRVTSTAKRSFDDDNKGVTKDSLTGVAIMVVTLLMMSVWGRICAILCMSAWLYCVALLRGRPNIMSQLKIKMASKLYRKSKVVGFFS